MGTLAHSQKHFWTTDWSQQKPLKAFNRKLHLMWVPLPPFNLQDNWEKDCAALQVFGME